MPEFVNTPTRFEFDYRDKSRTFNDLILIQLGERTSLPDDHISTHIHDDFIEISYINSGRGIFYIDNKGTELEQGDLFLCLPFETHSISSDKEDPLHYSYFAFSFKFGTPFRDIAFNDAIMSLNSSNRKAYHPEFAEKFKELISILKDKKSYDELEFELTAKRVALNVFQIYSKIKNENTEAVEISKEHELYFKIIHYIEKNLIKIRKLTDISNGLNYNYVYISRVFKKHYGEAISVYFNSKKLDYAKQLIIEKRMSISEISDFLGYSCLPVFSKIFKKQFGISPLKYYSSAVEKY